MLDFLLKSIVEMIKVFFLRILILNDGFISLYVVLMYFLVSVLGLDVVFRIILKCIIKLLSFCKK